MSVHHRPGALLWAPEVPLRGTQAFEVSSFTDQEVRLRERKCFWQAEQASSDQQVCGRDRGEASPPLPAGDQKRRSCGGPEPRSRDPPRGSSRWTRSGAEAGGPQRGRGS